MCSEEKSTDIMVKKKYDHSKTLVKLLACAVCYRGDYYDNKAVKRIDTGLQQCQYCRTEYKVVFKHNDACGIKLTITIWKDLGRGPKSEEWEGHLRETCTGIILEVFPLKLNPRKERLLQALKVGCTETGYGDQTL